MASKDNDKSYAGYCPDYYINTTNIKWSLFRYIWSTWIYQCVEKQSHEQFFTARLQRQAWRSLSLPASTRIQWRCPTKLRL